MSLSTNQFRLLVAGLIALIMVLALLVLLTFSNGPGGVLAGLAQASPTPAPVSAGAFAGEAAVSLSESPDTGEAASQAASLPSTGPDVAPQPDLPPESVSEVSGDTGTEAQSDQQSGSDSAQTGSGPGVTPQVDLSPGIYRVFVRAEDSFDSVRPVVDEGQCGQYPFFTSMPGPFEGSATYRSTGCRVHFEITGTGGDWSITVEPAAQSGLLTVPVTFSGDKPATTDRVDLPEGEYRLYLTTSSQYSMVVPIIAEGLCLERPVFLETTPGQFETTYKSTGCQIVFQISSVTAGWEFSILPKE